MSFRSGLNYHTKYKVTIPSASVELIVSAAIEVQERLTYLSKPLWKGRVHIYGSVEGSNVTGYGFLEVFLSSFLPYYY
jgi:hypothetical protein